MGLEWDPEGDADRRKETRKRLLLTIAIVAAILGFVGKKLYERHQQEERERDLQILQDMRNR